MRLLPNNFYEHPDIFDRLMKDPVFRNDCRKVSSSDIPGILKAHHFAPHIIKKFSVPSSGDEPMGATEGREGADSGTSQGSDASKGSNSTHWSVSSDRSISSGGGGALEFIHECIEHSIFT